MDDYYIGWSSEKLQKGVIYKNNIAYACFYKYIDDYPVDPMFGGSRNVSWFTTPIFLGRTFDSVEDIVAAIKNRSKHV